MWMLLRYYDLYQRLQLEFYVLLMMGAMDTRNTESDVAVNKYLHTVASCWILLICNKLGFQLWFYASAVSSIDILLQFFYDVEKSGPRKNAVTYFTKFELVTSIKVRIYDQIYEEFVSGRSLVQISIWRSANLLEVCSFLCLSKQAHG